MKSYHLEDGKSYHHYEEKEVYLLSTPEESEITRTVVQNTHSTGDVENLCTIS